MATESMAQRIVAIHASLEGGEIPHAFGGAIALAFHTLRPRATSDININIALSVNEAVRVFRAMPLRVRWTLQQIRVAQILEEVRLRWMRGGSVDLFLPKMSTIKLWKGEKSLIRLTEL